MAPHQLLLETPEGGFETVRDCPLRVVWPSTWELLHYYRLFQKGHLPFAGCADEQPRRILRWFAWIDQELTKKTPNAEDVRKQEEMKDAARRAHLLAAQCDAERNRTASPTQDP